MDVFLDAAARIAAVTRDQAARAAAEWLRPTSRTVGWFKPVK